MLNGLLPFGYLLARTLKCASQSKLNNEHNHNNKNSSSTAERDCSEEHSHMKPSNAHTPNSVKMCVVVVMIRGHYYCCLYICIKVHVLIVRRCEHVTTYIYVFIQQSPEVFVWIFFTAFVVSLFISPNAKPEILYCQPADFRMVGIRVKLFLWWMLHFYTRDSSVWIAFCSTVSHRSVLWRANTPQQ